MTNLKPSDKQPLLDQIPKWKGHKILLIGDVGLDEYILGEVRRISPEAPVPVLDVESEDYRLGLAGNVAQNIRSLGGDPYLVSVVGRDSGYETLSRLFKNANVDPSFLVFDESRPTTRKSRIMAKHHHLVRVDYENRKVIAPAIEAKILAQILRLIPEVHLVIIEDYAKGVISSSLLKSIIEISHQHGKQVIVDPHRSNRADFYRGVDLIKPNFDEAVALSGLDYDELRDDPNKILSIAKEVLKKTGAHHIVMTQGKAGMTIMSGDSLDQVPTYARQVFDVTGAGDTVIATLGLALSAKVPLVQACQLANFAAGVVVGQIGCVPCSIQELKTYIEENV